MAESPDQSLIPDSVFTTYNQLKERGEGVAAKIADYQSKIAPLVTESSVIEKTIENLRLLYPGLSSSQKKTQVWRKGEQETYADVSIRMLEAEDEVMTMEDFYVGLGITSTVEKRAFRDAIRSVRRAKQRKLIGIPISQAGISTYAVALPTFYTDVENPLILKPFYQQKLAAKAAEQQFTLSNEDEDSLV